MNENFYPARRQSTTSSIKYGIFLCLIFLLFGANGRADELTVYDGTTTNNYVPAYMGYFDDFTRSQFVIPSADLTSVNGAVISGLKFYTTSYNVPYTSVSTVDVYVKEVNYTSITGFETKASSTVVYTGTLSVETAGDGGELTINFSTPYQYNGGNLMIGIENTTDAGYKFIYFYGQTINGASIAGYNGSSLANVTATQRNFIPKTTIYYTVPPCEPTWTGTSNYYITGFTVTNGGTTLLSSTSTGTTRTTTDYYYTRSITASAGDVLRCVTTMSGGSTYGFAMWIDYNQDGLDAGDLQYSTTTYESSPYSRSVTIPASTPVGEYRLRIWGDFLRGSASDPCGSYSTGEAEDYRLIVVPPPDPDLPEVCQGFESGALPSGWTTTNSWAVGIGDYSGTTTGTHSGSYNALRTHTSRGDEDYLTSPEMDLSGIISATLSFWYINRSWSGDIDGFGVEYRVGGGAWQSLFSTTDAHAAWTQQTIELPAAALAADFQIRFKYTDNYGYGVGLDDICMELVQPESECEDFETGALPAGWTQTGPGSWSVGTGDYSTATGAHDGTYNALINHSSRDNETYLITPANDFSGYSWVTLSFWYVNRSWGGDIDALTVYYRVNNGAWQQIYNTEEAHGIWTQQTISLPAGALAANCQIAFKMTDDYGYGVGIDDVCFIHPPVDCTNRTASITGCSAATLTIGNTRQLTGSVSDGAGDASWTSSNTSVATVSPTGLVTAVAPGTAEITYTVAMDGTYCTVSETCTINVNCSEGAWNISDITGSTQAIECNSKSYCFFDSGGPDDTYTDGEDYTVTFTSSGVVHISFLEFQTESVSWDYLTITGSDNDGTYGGTTIPAEFVSTGNSITVTWHSDGTNHSYSGWKAVITAEECCSIARTIEITDCPTEELLWHSTAQLGYTVSAGGGTVVWSSSDESVATVSSTGLVTALTPGTATITARIPNSGDYCSAETTCEVNVTCGGSTKTVGTETNTSYSYAPVNGNYYYSMRQIIYDKSELCIGAINSVAFYYAYSSASPERDNVKIFMGTRPDNTFGSTTDYTSTDGMTEVYSGRFNFTSEGWRWFDLATPYVYDGSGSLVMMIVDNSHASWNTSCVFRYSSCDGYKMLRAERDGSTPYDVDDLSTAGWSVTNYRPNTMFCINCCTERTGAGDFEFCRESVVLNVGDVLNFPVDGFEGVTPTGTLTYGSSNSSVASIEGSTVTAVGAGSTTISASIAYDDPTGYCPVTTSYQVVVLGSGSTCQTVGDGNNTTSNAPLYALYDNSYVQMIYKKDDIGGCGCKIKSITFYSTAANSNPRETQVYISTTDKDMFSSNTDYVAQSEPVWSGTWSIVSGENTFSFDPSIDFDCTKNLLISFNCHGSWSGNSFSAFNYDNSVLYYYRDGDVNTYTPADMSSFSGSRSSSLPQLKICFDNCTSTPIPSVSVDQDDVTSCKDVAINPITVTASEGTLSFSPELSTLGLSYNSTTHQITGAVNSVGNHDITITLTALDNCLKDQVSTTIHITTIDADIEFPEP